MSSDALAGLARHHADLAEHGCGECVSGAECRMQAAGGWDAHPMRLIRRTRMRGRLADPPDRCIAQSGPGVGGAQLAEPSVERAVAGRMSAGVARGGAGHGPTRRT